MTKVGEELLEATPEEIDGLINKLQQYLPESAIIHGALLTRKAFKGMSEVYETKIYHSRISSLVVATSIYSKITIQSMSIFWDTNAEDESDVVRLLLTIPKIDWTQPFCIGRTSIIVLEKIQRMVERGALGEGFLRPHGIRIATYLYSIEESPDEPCVPDGLEVRPLTDEHAGFVFSHWKYNFFESFETYKELLRVAPGIGLFKNDNNAIRNYENGSKDEPNSECTSTKEKELHYEGYPISWTFLNQFNLISNTFTLEEYRGKKFSTMVTNAMIKKALQETGYVSTLIVYDNLVSIKLHEKIGFVKQHALGFQYYSSLNPDCIVNETTDPFFSKLVNVKLI